MFNKIMIFSMNYSKLSSQIGKAKGILLNKFIFSFEGTEISLIKLVIYLIYLEIDYGLIFIFQK